MFVRLAMLAALLSIHAHVLAATEKNESASVTSLQHLAVQLKRSFDRSEQGSPPSAVELSRFDRLMSDMKVSVDGSDTANSRKFRAIELLYGELKYDAAHPSSARTNVPAVDRTRFDTEVVSAQHGALCSNALGIGNTTPVRLALAKSASAWFAVSASNAGSLQLTTQSSGPDPALEVFTSCAEGAQPVANNDDSFGLDASVTTNPLDRPAYIRLTNTGETGVISLALAAVESIKGTVRSAATNQPISSIEIDAFSGENGFFGSAYTDQNGAYTLTPSQPGTYFVLANISYYFSFPSYLSQLYPSGYCAFYFAPDPGDCDQSNAKTITVGTTGTISNINFSLTQGAQLSGQVRDSAGAPLFATVSLSSVGSTLQISPNTDSVGHYVFKNLPPGSYQIEATAYGYGSQYFDHIACAGVLQNQCDGVAGTPVTVGASNVSDIDFNLPRLSSITGTTVADDGTTPVETNISVYDTSGSLVAGTTSYAGTYTVGPLVSGTYYVVAGGYGYFAQLYADHDCVVNCLTEFASGTPVTLSFTGQTATANFSLQPLPALRGRVVDSNSGAALPNVQIVLNTQPPAAKGYPSYWIYTDSDGNYTLSSIPLGRYYAWAVSANHIDQIYAGIPCEADHESSLLTANCDVSTATLVSITPDQTPGDVNFSLVPSSNISGRAAVRSAGDVPASSALITIVDGTGSAVQGAYTDATGNYVATDLTAETFYAVAGMDNYNSNGAYGSQIWQNLDCTSPCVATTGTPIPVAAQSTVSGIDFSLTRQDAIVGRVIDSDGIPIPNVVVDIFNTTDKSYIGGAATDINGFYVLPAILGAAYYVATESTGGYTDQVYSGISCPAGNAYDEKCSLAGATSVNVGNGATQPHVVNFTLMFNDRVFHSGFE